MPEDSMTFMLSATSNLHKLSTWVEILQNIALTVAAGVGLWLTWTGLTTWKRQHIGTTKWDLARRYVKQCLLVRNELLKARNSLQEIPIERKEGEDRAFPTRDEEKQATRKHYWGHWNHIVEKMVELDVLALELRAAGELQFESLNKALSTLLWEYNFAIRTYIDSQEEKRKLDKKRFEEMHWILWRDTENKDDFSVKLEKVFEQMETQSRQLMEKIDR